MIRTLSLAGGVAGALALSQYPEFSQQYLQRLAGQVDALTTVAVDFDTSALEAGLGREEALAQMTGTAFLSERQSDMRRTFARHAQLSENLALLRAATPLERVWMPHRLGDVETLQATWADFAPAVPTSSAGAASAGIGFIAGYAAFGGLLSMIAMPFRVASGWVRRRRQEREAAKIRRDPPVLRPPRPTLVSENPGFKPTLAGETR